MKDWVFKINKQKFTQRSRFKRNDGFGQVLRNKPDLSFWFCIYHQISNECSKLGISVAKKIIPTAVERNHFKRIIRETFRKSLTTTPPIDIVVRVRKRPTSNDWKQVAKLFDIELQKVLSVYK